MSDFLVFSITKNDLARKYTVHGRYGKKPSRSKKAGRFQKLLGFARSHSIMTRSSVSLSASLHHFLPAFLNLNGSSPPNVINGFDCYNEYVLSKLCILEEKRLLFLSLNNKFSKILLLEACQVPNVCS